MSEQVKNSVLLLSRKTLSQLGNSLICEDLQAVQIGKCFELVGKHAGTWQFKFHQEVDTNVLSLYINASFFEKAQ